MILETTTSSFAIEFVPFLPVVFIGIFIFVTAIIAIVSSIKNKGKIQNLIDEDLEEIQQSAKNILSNSVFGSLKQDEEVSCEYCGSSLPKGTTKCPYCSASIRKSKK